MNSPNQSADLAADSLPPDARAALPPPAASGHSDRERQAAQLRDQHRAWIVIWLARDGVFKAYQRKSRRRDTALSAATPEGLTIQINQAEQAIASGVPR